MKYYGKRFECPTSEQLDEWERNNTKAIERIDFWTDIVEKSAPIVAFTVFLIVLRMFY